MEARSKTHPPLSGCYQRFTKYWPLLAIIIFIYLAILTGKVASDLRRQSPGDTDHAPEVQKFIHAAAETASSVSLPGGSELAAGGDRQFSSARLPRALGLKFSLRYPRDWKQARPDGPQVLAKFVSGQGKNAESLVIFVAPERPKSPIISEQFRKEIFNGILAGYRCKYCAVSSRPVKLAGHEGVAVSFEDFKNKAHLKVTNYLLPVGNKLITIQCRVESPKKDAELEARFQRCRPLFDRIAQSLALN